MTDLQNNTDLTDQYAFERFMQTKMHLTGLQNNTDLTNKFQNMDIQKFYQNSENFPRLVTHAMQVLTLFRGTCVSK